MPFQLSNGSIFRFPQVDHEVGIMATADPSLLSEFDNAIRRQIGAVFEIGQGEYDELLQKKTALGTLPPRWREELSSNLQYQPQSLQQTPQQTTANAVVAEVKIPEFAKPSARTT